MLVLSCCSVSPWFFHIMNNASFQPERKFQAQKTLKSSPLFALRERSSQLWQICIIMSAKTQKRRPWFHADRGARRIHRGGFDMHEVQCMYNGYMLRLHVIIIILLLQQSESRRKQRVSRAFQQARFQFVLYLITRRGAYRQTKMSHRRLSTEASRNKR
jgi:hypothetical protein